VILNTVHASKGTEYPHVLLCGDWSGAKSSELEEERRVLYVGMTRARHTLTIFNRMDRRNPLAGDLSGPCFAARRETTIAISTKTQARDYVLLGLDDVFLDYAGQKESKHPIHTALTSLQPGSKLTIRQNGRHPTLVTPERVNVAQLSSKASETWGEKISKIQDIRVVCMIVRQRSDCKEAEYQSRLRVDQWEIPVCEITI